MNHGLNQAGARFPRHLTHHPEIEIAQAAVGEGQEIAGMGVSVEKAVLQKLLQAAVHAHFHHVVGIDPELAHGFEVGEFDPVDPFHRQHAPARGFSVDPRNGDAGVVPVELTEFFGVARFVEVVHLLEHPSTQFINQGN